MKKSELERENKYLKQKLEDMTNLLNRLNDEMDMTRNFLRDKDLAFELLAYSGQYHNENIDNDMRGRK